VCRCLANAGRFLSGGRSRRLPPLTGSFALTRERPPIRRPVPLGGKLGGKIVKRRARRVVAASGRPALSSHLAGQVLASPGAGHTAASNGSLRMSNKRHTPGNRQDRRAKVPCCQHTIVPPFAPPPTGPPPPFSPPRPCRSRISSPAMRQASGGPRGWAVHGRKKTGRSRVDRQRAKITWRPGARPVSVGG
jgi:hypothetical protein